MNVGQTVKVKAFDAFGESWMSGTVERVVEGYTVVKRVDGRLVYIGDDMAKAGWMRA